MSKVMRFLAVCFLISGLIIGFGVTVYLFTVGIDLIKNGEVFRGLLYVLAWSELGGIAAGVALIGLGAFCLNWTQRHPGNGGASSA